MTSTFTKVPGSDTKITSYYKIFVEEPNFLVEIFVEERENFDPKKYMTPDMKNFEKKFFWW
jgi:hypothetical protein